MVGLLLIGLICNLCVKPVAAKHHYREDPDREEIHSKTAQPREA